MALTPRLSEDRTGCLRIWDMPQEGREYVAGIDVAEGRKRDRTALQRRGVVSYSDSRPDYSAVIVLEMETALHVATWHGYVPPDELATIAAAIGWLYNSCLLVPELNGPGLAVVTRLTETLAYDNIYRSQAFNVLDRDPFNPQFGFRTDAVTRKILMLRVHEMLNSNKLFTRDRRLAAELRTMEFDDQGTERARGSNKDDCVLALALALQGRYTSIGLTPMQKTERRPTARALDDQAWDAIERKMHGQSGGGGGGSRGLYPGGGRGHWPGRGHV